MGKLLLLLIAAILVTITTAGYYEKPRVFQTKHELPKLGGDLTNNGGNLKLKEESEKEEDDSFFKLGVPDLKEEEQDWDTGSGDPNSVSNPIVIDTETKVPVVKEDVILAGKPLNRALEDKEKNENEVLIETSLGPLPLQGKLPREIDAFYPVSMPTDFKAYDVNNTDGYITLQELIDVTGASENVDEVFGACDKDGDGKLSPKEFETGPWSLGGDPQKNTDPYILKEEIREEMMADGIQDPIVTLQEENWKPNKPPPFGLFG